jgi:uncharacterized delta-60 repeat protein
MKKLFFLLFLSLSFLANAQNPGDVAQNFGKFPGFNASVDATVAIQANGKILVAGSFSTYEGATSESIIRLNPDGSKDTSFSSGTGFNNSVYAIAVQADGKILVGGFFTAYNGATENSIIRLNPDGSKDTSFSTGTGFDESVNAIAVQADGKILVGGDFTTYKGAIENRIIRLNPDGSKDTSFIAGTGFDDLVSAIAVQADGKILLGGIFTAYNGATENRIIRLNPNGSKDSSFSTGTGFNGTVKVIAIQADSKILVGGDSGIIRLNANGSIDNSFSTGSGFDSTVRVIAIQADSKILVGGNFSTYNGATENRIIRLNTDGSKDSSLSTGTGIVGSIFAIAVQADGKIIMGGFFSIYNGDSANNIIRLNTNGSKDISFGTGTGFNDKINAVKVQADGKILVGGIFTAYKGGAEKSIIRLNTNGSKDASFITGTGIDGSITAIAVQADGKIIMGGFFENYNGDSTKNIIRLNADGSKDASFISGTSFNGWVYTIAVQADGKILVGGNFQTYNGATQNSIIRLNTDGSKDSSFNTGAGFNNFVWKIALQADGKILVGGSFDTYKGVAENRIIRLNPDGSKDSSFTSGTGFNESVLVIAVQTDGKILVGGNFNTYKGIAENNIIRLNTDGSKDTSFITGTGPNANVNAIELQADSKILVGGDFITYNGVAENRIIRLNTNGSKDTSFSTGTGLNDSVFAITINGDGKILVGGLFTTYKDDNNSALLIGLHSEISLGTPTFNDSKVDLQGKLILEGTNETINVSNLTNGLYIVKVSTDQGEFTNKFIKE